MLNGIIVAVLTAVTQAATGRSETVEQVARLMESGYSYPEVGLKMAASIRERLRRGEYKDVEPGDGLARRLTEDLRSVSHDLHILVRYSPEVLPAESEKPTEPSPEEIEQQRRALASDSFGIRKAEVLAGNVGYLDFRYFAPVAFAACAYHASMALVAETDALIIDLRQNGGSMDPEAIPMLLGYFFERPVHLTDLKWRWEPSARQYWTAASVPGKKYLDKPVYLLTSPKTFSGAEEIAYDLQALKRATIVGGTTAGGANPNVFRRVNDHFDASVPSGIVTSAVTGTNWEGKGVSPDVATPPASALRTAHLAALKRLYDVSKEQRFADALRVVEETPSGLKKVTFSLKGFPDAKKVIVVGTFNYWSTESDSLRKEGDRWVADVMVEPGRHAYKFVVDGRWTSDPANPKHEPGTGDTDSVVVVD
jgi:hypothetical protein